VRGRIGRALVAIRDQPIAAETMGINAALYKTTCFGVSALYAGVAGGLSAIAVGFVSPESFGLALSLAFLVGIVVGGLASLGGALFGALFIEFVPNIADQLTVGFGEGAKALPGAIYGVLLILVMAALPTGAAGAARAAPSTGIFAGPSGDPPPADRARRDGVFNREPSIAKFCSTPAQRLLGSAALAQVLSRALSIGRAVAPRAPATLAGPQVWTPNLADPRRLWSRRQGRAPPLPPG